MKLDPDLIQYLQKDHFRVLTAIEMGMKNHEFVPVPLIESLASLKRGNCFNVISLLLKHKLIFHTGKNYSGYALTYQGYDYLALKVFMKRGHVKRLLCQIGVGKESDIYICESGDKVDEATGKSVHNGEPVVIKFARLGRTSFRSIKDNRDYLKGRQCGWLYMSRIASLKEFAFMTALYKRGFPTPTPYEGNRHAICMSLVKAYPLVNVKGLTNPETVYHMLIEQIIKFAEHGLVHGDFNEFNLMCADDETITVIDFPQMTSTSHLNAQFYFERDVRCIQTFFTKRFGLAFEGIPQLDSDVVKTVDLDKEIKASGYFEEGDLDILDQVGQELLDGVGKQDQEHQIDESNDVDEELFEIDPEMASRPDEVMEEEKQVLEGDKNGDGDEEEEGESDEDEDDTSKEWRLKREAREQKRKLKQESLEKDTSNKKLQVNLDYVKEKARRQYLSNKNKQVAKRNNNKDKGTMKGKEDIRDCFLYDDI